MSAPTGIAAMTADPNWRPTREQVADLIARALSMDLDPGDPDGPPLLTVAEMWEVGWRAGYAARVAEEEAEWRRRSDPDGRHLVTRWVSQATARMAADGRPPPGVDVDPTLPAAGTPRDGDYRGGPVPAW